MVHAFPKVISLKVNIIMGLEFELTYFEAAVQYYNHYTTVNPSLWITVLIVFTTASIANLA